MYFNWKNPADWLGALIILALVAMLILGVAMFASMFLDTTDFFKRKSGTEVLQDVSTALEACDGEIESFGYDYEGNVEIRCK